MSGPFTPEQEERIREIAHKEAVRVAIAAAGAQATHNALEAIDRFQLSRKAIEAALAGEMFRPSVKELRDA